MPIKSYLAYPMTGQREALHSALADLDGCTVMPSTNTELMILVTDTPDDAAEELLGATLRDITALQSLAMVAGYSAPLETPDESPAP